MADFLNLNVHLHLDVVEVLIALLDFVPLQLVVIGGLGTLLLGRAQGHVFLLDLLLGHLLVLLQLGDQRVLLRPHLLQVDELLIDPLGIVLGCSQIRGGHVELFKSPIVSDLQLTVRVVHRIEFALELQAQLHLLLVVLRVLHVFFFKLEPELLLPGPVFLQMVVVVTHSLHVLLQDFLCVYVVLNLFFELALDHSQFFVVLVCYFCDQDPIVRLAAVLQQHLVNLPDGGDNLEIFGRGRKHFLQ